MDDRAIRDNLLAYLKAHHPSGRVFQEKMIGTAICDVMLVTDSLTGYEIKSDRDNYARLHKQVFAYDRYFDANYAVIGASHRSSISR